MAVLVQTLIDQARVLSNLKGNQFYSDNDIGNFINDAALELKDIFDEAYEHYFALTQDFTLAGGIGANTIALNTDFEKAQLVLKDALTNAPSPVPMLPALAQRSSTDYVPGIGRCYYISGTPPVLEILPPSSAAGTYRLFYTPQLGNIWTNTPASDSLPQSLIPWQMFLKARAAIFCRTGRRQPSDDIAPIWQQQVDRARRMAKNRSEGVQQAPIARLGRGFWGDDTSGAGLG